jgi:hypothetical protein
MRYKVKWKSGGDGPLTPETFDTEGAAKARVRQLVNQHPRDLQVDVWNEDETWQIVTPAGIAEWCKA